MTGQSHHRASHPRLDEVSLEACRVHRKVDPVSSRSPVAGGLVRSEVWQTCHRPIKERFGDRVRDLRAQAELSQEEAAYRCKISRTYLSQLEAGKRNPSLTSLEKIAKALWLNSCGLIDLHRQTQAIIGYSLRRW